MKSSFVPLAAITIATTIAYRTTEIFVVVLSAIGMLVLIGIAVAMDV